MKNRFGLGRIMQIAMIVSMANCFIMVLVTVLDIMSRHMLKRPVPGVIELNEVLMIGIVFLGLGMAQREKAHIRAELFIIRLRPAVRKWFDFVALAVSLIFWALLLSQAVPGAIESYTIGEYREGLIKFPIWPARWALALGLFLICLQLAADMISFFRGEGSSEAGQEA
jgi:TRAP-type C4-dicarboxylate transport system permease small subunit